jgi:hypothetical protein
MQDGMTRGLGYFSIALGLAELAAPRRLRRAAGIDAPDALVRGYGARTIANGIALLTTRDAAPWMWGRVAGDALDIATVALAPADWRDGDRRKPWALGVLLAVAAIDLYCAARLSREKGGHHEAPWPQATGGAPPPAA